MKSRNGKKAAAMVRKGVRQHEAKQHPGQARTKLRLNHKPRAK